MAGGRINSPGSIRTASRVVRAFGGWSAVERAAHLRDDGVYVIRRSEMDRARRHEGKTED